MMIRPQCLVKLSLPPLLITGILLSYFLFSLSSTMPLQKLLNILQSLYQHRTRSTQKTTVHARKSKKSLLCGVFEIQLDKFYECTIKPFEETGHVRKRIDQRENGVDLAG